MTRIGSAAEGTVANIENMSAADVLLANNKLKQQQDEAKARARLGIAAAVGNGTISEAECISLLEQSPDNRTAKNARGINEVCQMQIDNLMADCMRSGQRFAITQLPAAIAATPSHLGSTAPILRSYNAGHSMSGGDGDVPAARTPEEHRFVRWEYHCDSRTLSALRSLQISLAENGTQPQIAGRANTPNHYWAAPEPSQEVLTSAFGTTATGIAGTMYVPDPELDQAYVGPMGDESLWRIYATPNDIREIQVLKVTAESATTSPDSENLADSTDTAIAVTDPTTALTTIGEGKKIATNLSYSSEVGMKNFLGGFQEVFGIQGVHQLKIAMNKAMTSGDGTGDNPLGITTAITALANIADNNAEIAKAALASASEVNGDALLDAKSQVVAGVRGSRSLFMASDAFWFRFLRNERTVGNSGLLDTSTASDRMGYVGTYAGSRL